MIAGWAWDFSPTNVPVSVDVYSDGVFVARWLADSFRQDLLNAGIGNGAHGFFGATPASLKDGVQHTITVRFTGTSQNLSATPKLLSCSP